MYMYLSFTCTGSRSHLIEEDYIDDPERAVKYYMDYIKVHKQSLIHNITRIYFRPNRESVKDKTVKTPASFSAKVLKVSTPLGLVTGGVSVLWERQSS